MDCESRGTVGNKYLMDRLRLEFGAETVEGKKAELHLVGRYVWDLCESANADFYTEK